MGRWQRRKAERQRRSAQRRAHGLPDAEPHDAEPHEAEPHEAEPHDAGDDALDAISASLCPECGEPVRWSMAIELLDHDPELFGRLEELLGPELLAETDVWTCPACGASGVVIDEDGYDPEGFAPDPLGSDPLDSDPLGSASYDPKEPGSDPEESDPDESTGLDDLFCRACRSPLEWLDPARVRSIDRAAYLRAQEQYGAEALLEGDAAACWTCGRITFYPDDGRWFR